MKVRSQCIKRIIDNYESLLELCDICSEEKLDQETKARIVGCKEQDGIILFLILV